jgi:hypothetical protein
MSKLYRVNINMEFPHETVLPVTFQGNRIGNAIIHKNNEIEIFIDDQYMSAFETIVGRLDVKSFSLEVVANGQKIR